MKHIILFLFTVVAYGQAPVLSYATMDAPTSACVRMAWVSDINATHEMELYQTSGGSVWQTIQRIGVSGVSQPDPFINHVVLACGLVPSTTYWAKGCSVANATRVCTSEQSATTPAAGSSIPTPPTPVDVGWPAGIGTTRTVGADCTDPSTGLQAQINAAIAAGNTGDRIVIPTTTRNCGLHEIRDFGAGTNGILVTTDSSNRPPAGSRDSAEYGHSVIHRNFSFMVDTASIASLVGNVDLATYGPGSLVYRSFIGTWDVRKAALAGSPVTITGCTNASPIVCTTASAHGFTTGQAFCIDSVLGNLAANGCFKAGTVTSNTVQLLSRFGDNQPGSGAYTSGGRLQGLVWTTITPTQFAGRPGLASCPTPGAWAWDNTQLYYMNGIYRCTDGNFWLKVEVRQGSGQPSDFSSFYESAISANIGAHHFRYRGINFADPGWPPEPEYAYGPVFNAAGFQIGGIFQDAHDVHHIDLDQNIGISDPSKWRTYIMWGGASNTGGYGSHIIVRNGVYQCGAYSLAYMSEPETQCFGFDETGGPGPFGFTNNSMTTGGWAFFLEGTGGYNIPADSTITGNDISGLTAYYFGTPTYSQPARVTQPITQRVRQLVEFKAGTRIKISGNQFYGVPFSVTSGASAIATGAQTTSIFANAITTGGVATANPTNPRPVSVAVGDRLMSWSTSSGVNSILRVASKTATTVSLTLLNGSAYNLGATTSGFLCNLDTAPVNDIEITNNIFRGVPMPWLGFGYTFGFLPGVNFGMCQLGPSSRVMLTNNQSTLENTFAAGAGAVYPSGGPNGIQSPAFIGGFVNDVTFFNNTNYCPDTTTTTLGAAVWSDGTTVSMKNNGFTSYANILCAENLGIFGAPIGSGTTLLDSRWPQGWAFTRNAYVRSGGTISGEPSGNVFPTRATVQYNSDGSVRYSSPYYAYSADPVAISRARGLITNIRPSATSSTVVVRFTSPVAGQNWYAETSVDGGTTWVRATSTGSGYEQTATVAAVTKTVYDVRVIGPTGITTIGKLRTQ